jgi:membrane protein DedA with SNARE-associated domain
MPEALLVAYGSALILPLAVIEGPFVSIVTGALAARGYVDWRLALPLLVCGDLIGDLIYYAIGRSGGAPLGVVFRRLGVGAETAEGMRQGLERNATKMLFIGKWTHSIGCLVLIGSGMLRRPLPGFLLVNLLATVPKSAALLAIGGFAGASLPLVERHVVPATIVLAAAGLMATLMVLRRAHPAAGAGR